MGPELAALADAVNTLAARLAATEHRRAALLHDLAHELRTPLTAIDSTLEAVQDGVLRADEQTLTAVRAQTARLTRLIGDLTAASRTDEHAFTVTRRRVDLPELVAQVVAAQTARYAGAHVQLATRAEGPCFAAADPDRVAEVLDQLLDNALRHCASGQRVEVRVQPGPDGARLVVTDSGSGFPPEQAELLFERFARGTVPSPAGSGIGLTIARALVEAQGGTLTAASDGPGTGARFTVQLPGA
jgi:signal transduction histidine kinase